MVPDYEGLGTPGVHTYVVRRAQAHALLDAVRAAQRLRVAHLPDHGPVGLAGYSQGGGASAAAAEIAKRYAPGLAIKGAYAGAVPARLKAVARFLDGGPYAGFLLYALNGVQAAYGLHLRPILNASGEEALKASRHQCVTETIPAYAGTNSATLTESGSPLQTYLRQQPYRAIVAKQRIGDRKPNMPVFVASSPGDDVVPARSWCARGVNVQFATLAAATHVGASGEANARGFAFLDSRFAGLPAVSNCGTF